MHFIIEYAIQNTLIAALFAVIVYFVTRVWRNPPIAHLLWLLVLLKLIAPPLVALHWLPATMTRELTVPAPSFFADEGLSNQNPSPPGKRRGSRARCACSHRIMLSKKLRLRPQLSHFGVEHFALS